VSEHTESELKAMIYPEELPRIVDDCETTICRMEADDPQDIANAKHLVNCWNNHDQLLEVCKAAKEWTDDSAWAGREKIVIMCEAAIEAAERK